VNSVTTEPTDTTYARLCMRLREMDDETLDKIGTFLDLLK
jgi:hypothetical protein